MSGEDSFVLGPSLVPTHRHDEKAGEFHVRTAEVVHALRQNRLSRSEEVERKGSPFWYSRSPGRSLRHVERGGINERHLQCSAAVQRDLKLCVQERLCRFER